MPKKTTPSPIAVTTICSVCALGWELHGPDPTTDDCIRLLKAELASRPAYRGYYWYQQPFTTYYPQYPLTYPTINYVGGTSNSPNQASLIANQASRTLTNTPRTISGTVTPVTE